MSQPKEVIGEMSSSANQMAEAIDDMKNSSDETSKIIKTIDEIVQELRKLVEGANAENISKMDSGSHSQSQSKHQLSKTDNMYHNIAGGKGKQAEGNSSWNKSSQNNKVHSGQSSDQQIPLGDDDTDDDINDFNNSN